jgi:ribokinase
MKPIVVVGSINVDLVTHAERIPRAGETLTGTDFRVHSGGKGANQAVAVGKLGHPCTLLGAVGNDVFGDKLLRTLSAYGVDTAYIQDISGSSGTASIIVSSTAENCIVVTPGANACVTEDYLAAHEHVIKSAGMVLLQLEIPIASVEWVIRCCARNRVPVMLDPAPARPLTPEILSNVEWFTPNQTEADFYTGNGNADPAGQMLARLFAAGVRNVILKRGAEGALIANVSGGLHWTRAFEVNAVDTTAAGDAFNGAFAVALMRGLTVPECGRFAAAAAAISVTRFGAQPSLPTGKEVEDLMALATHGA